MYGDQLNPVLELDGNGTPLFRYVYASMAHSPDYVVDANGVNYRAIRDQLGSPVCSVAYVLGSSLGEQVSRGRVTRVFGDRPLR